VFACATGGPVTGIERCVVGRLEIAVHSVVTGGVMFGLQPYRVLVLRRDFNHDYGGR